MDALGWTAYDRGEPEMADCVEGRLLVFHVFRGVVTETWEKRRYTPMYTHWKRIPRQGWIAAATRKPARKDADIRHCVLARSEMTGIRVTGYHQFETDRYLTHWMPVPSPPTDAEQYKQPFLWEDRT